MYQTELELYLPYDQEDDSVIRVVNVQLSIR